MPTIGPHDAQNAGMTGKLFGEVELVFHADILYLRTAKATIAKSSRMGNDPANTAQMAVLVVCCNGRSVTWEESLGCMCVYLSRMIRNSLQIRIVQSVQRYSQQLRE